MAMDMVLWKIKTGLNDTAGSVFKAYVTKSLEDKIQAAQDEVVAEAVAHAKAADEAKAQAKAEASADATLMGRLFG